MNELEIFTAALELADAAARDKYLDEVCGDSAERRARLEALIRNAAQASRYLESPPTNIEATLDGLITERVGTQIGPYKLLEQIGEGGMGVVYMAQQSEPVKRRVALKLIKPGMDTRQVIARFEAERQALALMDHPHIARVLDAGATETGRPYFVMELVYGIPITEFCDREQLDTRQRLKLLIDVCRAVQHAHQKAIIHRDLKPSNVLVTLHDGGAVVKVIDFGVAKALDQELTERTLFTQFSQMVGTPLYMSPEQATSNAVDVDTRSDVYSLGVLLYELLTGTTPFDRDLLKNAGLDELRRIIREDDPPRPSARISTLHAAGQSTVSRRRYGDPRKLSELVRGELDWIVMRALEKDRTRRYQSASALAVDVQRYLDDLPVDACPPSAAYRLSKFSRRNRGLLTAVALVGVVLVLGAAVSGWQGWEATVARKAADERLKNEIKARADAELQQKRARVFLDQALAAIHQMLTRVSDDKLVDVPHMDAIRRELLDDALQLYRNLARESKGDIKTEQAVGNALQTLAAAQDPADAVKSNQDALALFQSLASRAPSEAEYLIEVADSYRFLGWSLWHVGRLDESEAACRASVRLGEQVYGLAPDAKRRIAQSKLILAYVLNIRKKYVEAEPILKGTLPFHEDDFARNPYRWWSLAVNLQHLGVAAQGLGRDSEAEKFLQSSKAVAEKYLDFLSRGSRSLPGQSMHPDKTELTGNLRSKSGAHFFVVNTSDGLGNLQEKLGRLEDAKATYRAARRIGITLVTDHPNVRMYDDWLRIIDDRLAALLNKSGRAEEAAQIIAERPAHSAADLLARAKSFETIGEFKKALADYDAALKLEPEDEELLRFRAEAAELLHEKESVTTEKN